MNVVALIADIVDSRAIPERARFQRSLKTTLAAVNKRSRRSLLSPVTLTLGDEFQAVYPALDSALAATAGFLAAFEVPLPEGFDDPFSGTSRD